MTLNVRDATPADSSLILELIEELAEYERLAHQCIATEELLSKSLFGTAPAAHVLIAEWEGEPVGFALYFFNYSTFLARKGIWLEDLFVRPTVRGHGIGRGLLSHLAARALSEGCGRLEWVVLDWNESAIGFYRSLGAEPLGDWTTYRVTGEALDALGSSSST